MLKVGVIGVGHLGRHHARVYAAIDSCELVGVSDTDARRATDVAREFGTRAFADADDLLGAVDAVSIAVPTSAHHEVGDRLARRLRCRWYYLGTKPVFAAADTAFGSLRCQGS